MKRGTIIFLVIVILTIIIGLVIIFWKKIKPAAVDAANTVADRTGISPIKQFNSGDAVRSEVDGLNFRTGPGTSFDSIYKFVAGETVGQVLQGTDANGWVEIGRYNGQLESETGFVYSAYLKLD